MKNFAIYGAGGFSREMFCIINQIAAWNFLDFFDDGVERGTETNFGNPAKIF